MDNKNLNVPGGTKSANDLKPLMVASAQTTSTTPVKLADLGANSKKSLKIKIQKKRLEE